MGKCKRELALYGKGGIGKSTISANLSAALAEVGERVLQIGCDPKPDSTRLLMRGRALPTVLEYLKDVPKEAARIEAVLGEGYRGIGCIEAGGPRPGVGCAGRGIISAFEFLERHKVKDNYDVVIYDVLGDVVCGGFAVPIRREYADTIFLVTSGEFMALYAANNILRGVRNFDGDRHRRVAGILYNRRNVAGEDQRVERFAAAVGLPVVATVPRSDAFARAEEKKLTVLELGEDGPERGVFLRLAEAVSRGLTLYEAKPLSDEDLESVVLYGRRASPLPDTAAPQEESASELPVPSPQENTERPDPNRLPLYGCAFNGAATAAIHLTDAIVIAHSPRACAFYTWQNISSPGRRNLFNRGILMPSAVSPNYECTDIGQTEAVFGGMDALRERVRLAMERRPGAVIVISSCVSGIIGDDVMAVEDMSTPEIPVIVIPADGDINGDYMTGIEMCMHALAERLIPRDPEATLLPDCVNLIGEVGVANNTDVNYRTVARLLRGMGIEVNCRFLGDATAAQVRRLPLAPLNIPAVDSPDNRRLIDWLREKYALPFYDGFLPVGYRETAEFLRRIAGFFGRPDAAENVIEQEKALYDAEAARLRPLLQGKRVVMTTINANLDWLLDAAEDVGLEFVWIGVLNYLRQEVRISAHPERRALAEEIPSLPMVRERIAEHRPDIVISNYTSAAESGDYILDNLPMGQLVGFRSGLAVMDRWHRLLQTRREGEWMRDQALFEKYFA